MSLGLVQEDGHEKVIYHKDMWNEKVSSSAVYCDIILYVDVKDEERHRGIEANVELI